MAKKQPSSGGSTAKVVNVSKMGTVAAIQVAREQAEAVKKKRASSIEKKKGWTFASVGTNLVTLAMIGYGCFAARNVYRIFQPDFPDEVNGRAVQKFKNRIPPGTKLSAQVWAGSAVSARPGTPPDWEFPFVYDSDSFEPQVSLVCAANS